ncbi:MAG: hypothetical protein AB8I56_02385 [Anaerolineales bacterium]|jgi:hypothetical protein
MRKATKTVTTWLGISAGIAGLEHGYFEILQGSTSTEGLMITSIGPPCVPEDIWNACEPALTILPDFLSAGILSLIVGLLILVWSTAFIQHKHGGSILMLLSVALLLVGGGLFPPLIGIGGGIAGTRINRPISRKPPGQILDFSSKLWPWLLVIFLAWIWGQWIVGYFLNDYLQAVMVYGVVFILILLPMSVFSAYARDVKELAG